MSAMVYQHAPNVEVLHWTENSTAIKTLGVDSDRAVTGYDTLAEIVAAGDLPYPGLGPTPIQALTLKCENGSGADGSAFYYAVNRDSVADELDMFPVSGSGQSFTIPGPIWNIWIKKSVGADEVVLSAHW